MKRKEQGERADLYTRITDKIVADLEKGGGMKEAASGERTDH